MKAIFQFILILGLSFSLSSLQAQENDGIPPMKIYENEENGLKFTVGGRFMADAAYYKTDYTAMKSGFSIVEARLRSSLTYKQWYFYADFDFVKGKAHQKNIFLRYNFLTETEGQHSLKLGYFNEPSTMSRNTSKYNLHFLTRPSAALALSPGRALGVSYKYYDSSFFFDQGVYSENEYNDQKTGNQGFSISGRWLYKPFKKSENLQGHIGITGRFAKINTGVQEKNVLRTEIDYASSLETKVDNTERFLNAKIPWASETLNLGAEALLIFNKSFIRGEYLFNKVYKDRPDEVLFRNQLGGLWSWQTLKSWQAGNPISSSTFDGFYVELGHLLRGSNYSYNNEYSVLNGSNNDGDLEIVARYSCSNLNDIKDGEFFFVGKNKFYPGGVVTDYPAASTSIGGGKLQTATIGLNYTFNKHAKIMCAYQYSNLDNVYFPKDKNFHTLQARLMFSF